MELTGPAGGVRLVDLTSIVAVVESASTDSREGSAKVIFENGDKVAISGSSFVRLRNRLVRGRRWAP